MSATLGFTPSEMMTVAAARCLRNGAVCFVGLPGQGPTAIITDLCIMEPDPSRKFVLTHLHAGVTRDQVAQATGWPLRFAPAVRRTAPPTQTELAVLRDLQRRSAEAHAQREAPTRGHGEEPAQ